jgi:FMRFamide related peptide family
MDGDSAKDVGRQKGATANRGQLIVCRGHECIGRWSKKYSWIKKLERSRPPVLVKHLLRFGRRPPVLVKHLLRFGRLCSSNPVRFGGNRQRNKG